MPGSASGTEGRSAARPPVRPLPRAERARCPALADQLNSGQEIDNHLHPPEILRTGASVFAAGGRQRAFINSAVLVQLGGAQRADQPLTSSSSRYESTS